MEEAPNEIQVVDFFGFSKEGVKATYEGLGSFEYNALKLYYDDNQILLLWENTVVCFYDNEIFNHIAVRKENGETIALLPSDKELFDLLFDEGYPYCSRTVPDKATYEGCISHQGSLGIAALNKFLSEK